MSLIVRPARTLVALGLLLVACRAEKPRTRSTDSAITRGPSFEVELEGSLSGEAGDGHRVVFVSVDPCDPARVENARTVAMAFLGPTAKNGAFGTEAAAREGSRFFLCAFALDASDRLVAFGQYPRNPITVAAPPRSESEVELEDLDVVLSRVTPRQLPVGRYRVLR